MESNTVTLNNAGKTLTFRFGHFATVRNEKHRQLLSNTAAQVLIEELLRDGWKKA